MSTASNSGIEADRSAGHKLKELFTSIVGQLSLLVVFLLVFGRLLDWVALNTGLIDHSMMISVLVGMSYSLAGVILLVGSIVGLVMYLR